jgi:predicted metal-dependent hydrolase
MQVELGNNLVDVIIEHKNNKNLYIRIKEDLKMYVTCNKYLSNQEIMHIIKTNEKSLLRMYNHELKINDKKDYYYFLGDKYTLVIDETVKVPEVKDDLIIVKDDKMLNKFYKVACQRIFQTRLDMMALKFDNIPEYHLKIRKMTSRWGVCNRGNNNITLNSELIKKDLTLLDYVCTHELSHFLEANHSAKFWLEVGKRYPNYKEARKALREA